jgi:F-type H+-transporting ATPase subunit b
LRKAQQGRAGQPPAIAPKPEPAEAPRPALHPRDAHGNCLQHGPNDRPAEINQVHGWLGVNNDKAVPPPGAPGTQAWWLWRATPYPWRYDNHDDHCDPRNEPVPLLAGIINLGALIYLLVRFGRRPLREALVKRRIDVTSEIDKARNIRLEAQKRVDRYQDDLEHLDDKLAAMRDQYAAEGVTDEARLVEDMQQARERMLADTDLRLVQEEKVLRDSLSLQALQDAVAAAEELLVAKVTEQDHQRLAEEYLEQIGPALLGGGGLEGRS